MKKENNTEKTMKTNKENTKTPFYKRAIFPWAIIVLGITFAGGVVVGSMITHAQNDQVRFEATQMVKSLSKPQSR